MAIKDLLYAAFGKRFAGTFSLIYLICKDNIENFPNRLASNAVGDSISLDGNITLKSGKKFAKVLIVVDSGEMVNTVYGYRSAKAIGNVFNCFLMKGIISDEWVNDNINTEFVAIIREKIGVYRVIGDISKPAHISASEGKSGSTLDTSKYWILTISDSTGQVAPYYTGFIKTSNSDFNNDFNNDFN